MQSNTLYILPCQTQETPIKITTISAVATEKNVQLILDIRATPGGGKQKNLSKKKMKKFFAGPTESNYFWEKTLSNRRKTHGMTPEILSSHALRVLGNASDVLVLVDHFRVIHRLLATDLPYTATVIEFPDPADVFSFSERPLSPVYDVDPGSIRMAEVERKMAEVSPADRTRSLDPQVTDVPRFALGEEFETAGRAFLEENGFVVISNVLSPEEIVHAETLLWNHLEGLGSGIRRDDVQTWNNDNWPDRQPSGVLAWEGIGQSPFLWFIRGRPNVRQAFEQALQSDTLITSFDGCGMFRPWQFDGSWKTKKSWLHVDQNPSFSPSFECLQGLVTLKDATESTGGFMCIPKSHKEFLNFYERNRSSTNKRLERAFTRTDVHLVRLPETDPLMNSRKIIPKLLAGDMILWDSRTMHCNSHAVDETFPDEVYDRAMHEWDLIRIVSYICMSTPEMIRKKGGDFETVIRQREHAVRNAITTNHMPFVYLPNLTPPMRKGTKSTLTTPSGTTDFQLDEQQWRLVFGN